ncbi:hypothetical protein SVAN01_11971, partial [Stagonosporopsis vannaccii]
QLAKFTHRRGAGGHRSARPRQPLQSEGALGRAQEPAWACGQERHRAGSLARGASQRGRDVAAAARQHLMRSALARLYQSLSQHSSRRRAKQPARAPASAAPQTEAAALTSAPAAVEAVAAAARPPSLRPPPTAPHRLAPASDTFPSGHLARPPPDPAGLLPS